MKKSKIIISTILLIAILMMSFMMFASNAATAAPNPKTYTGQSGYDVGGVNKVGNQIITIVSTVGSIAAVIVLVVLGLKYMMGSAEEKAEYKKTLLPYVIGAGLVFAASAIAGIIFGFMQGLGS